MVTSVDAQRRPPGLRRSSLRGQLVAKSRSEDVPKLCETSITGASRLYFDHLAVRGAEHRGQSRARKLNHVAHDVVPNPWSKHRPRGSASVPPLPVFSDSARTALVSWRSSPPCSARRAGRIDRPVCQASGRRLPCARGPGCVRASPLSGRHHLPLLVAGDLRPRP